MGCSDEHLLHRASSALMFLAARFVHGPVQAGASALSLLVVSGSSLSGDFVDVLSKVDEKNNLKKPGYQIVTK